MREQAKLAPESGERLGKFGALLQQTGKAIDDLIEPGQWRPCQGTEFARAAKGTVLGTMPKRARPVEVGMGFLC